MWKTLGGRCIYQGPGGAKVYQNFLYRWLTFESKAIQTLINPRKPAKPGLEYIRHLTLATRLRPADACLLGLGGAGVAHYLNGLLETLELHAVEYNPEVIDIANSYFMATRLNHLKIIEQDASLFVKQSATRYQHLMIDLFDAHSFPDHCNTDSFFLDCRQLLLPDGILAVNLANPQEQWPVFTHIRKVFDQRTVVLPVKKSSNMIVLAVNHDSLTPLLEMIKNSQCLKNLAWNTQWGCICWLV